MFGLAFGSFGNVVIYRVPLGLSVVSPPSACPRCGNRIAARHNVPLLGWLFLRGRCASCKAPISARYPIIEASVGVLFASVTWAYGVSWLTLLLLVGSWAAVILAAIDIDVRKLPVAIVFPWTVVSAIIILVASATTEGWDVGLRALIGGGALWLFYYAAHVVYPKGMGYGDVRLVAVVGMVLGFAGWGPLVVGGFAAFVWGLVGAIGPMIRARRVSGVSIPFGPWILVGAATGIVWGDAISSWYLGHILGV